MPNVVKLPQLGQTMEEGAIVAVNIKPGDKVEKGDVIFEIETDKATLEMESPAEGYVKKILVKTGNTYLVGEPVLVLGEKDEEVTEEFLNSLGVSEAQADTAAGQEAPAPAAEKPAKASKAPASANVVKLPQLGQTMEEGTIVAVNIKPGDKVEKGDVIFEIETDKATLEMESPAAGCVKAIIAEEGKTLLVGEPVLVLAEEDEEIHADFIESLKTGQPAPAPEAAQTTAHAAPSISDTTTPATKPQTPSGRIIASPRAKKTAAELNVDLASVTGTGPAGRIVEKDVQQAAKAAPAAKAASAQPRLGQTIPVNRLQKITAERMVQSKREIPCFYLTVKADVTDLVQYRSKLNETSDVKVAYNDFIIKAVAAGLEKFPLMTGQLDGDSIRLADSINIGLAIAVRDGLIAPVAKDVQKKDVKQVARDTKTLINKARNDKIELTDLEGGCTIVSNLGAFGIESFVPIVVPGQATILGIGQIADTCVPQGGNILVRKMMNMTLSVDHKVANGAYAAEFLDYVRNQLQDPANFD